MGADRGRPGHAGNGSSARARFSFVLAEYCCATRTNTGMNNATITIHTRGMVVDEATKQRDDRQNFGLGLSRVSTRIKLSKKWLWSPWRILPPPIAAYFVTGAYYSFIQTPDAWYRAFAPVLTISTFLIMAPLIKMIWMRNARRKFNDEDDSVHKN